MKRKVLSTILLGATVPALTGEAAEFIPLGDLPGGQHSSSAIDLSADGTTVLGSGNSETGPQVFRWNADTGFSLVPNFAAKSISGDGSIVGGTHTLDSLTQGVLWSQSGGFVGMGALPGLFSSFSDSVDVSSDGTAAALMGTVPETFFDSGLYWSSAGGLMSIGFLPEDVPGGEFFQFSVATAISGDSTTVVGSSFANFMEQAVRWTPTGGLQPLGFLGAPQSLATAVSADGEVIAGTSGLRAFRWTSETGMEEIGDFLPTGVSADGNTIVGNAVVDEIPVAMIWTPGTGAQTLENFLLSKFSLSLPGWDGLAEAAGISDDGTVLAGTGFNTVGLPEAFMVTLDAVVLPTGSIAFSGPVSLFLTDPDGNRYGTSIEDGNHYEEIPDLTLTVEDPVRTIAWPSILGGSHLVYLTGTGTGEYQLEFAFLHLDNETSGQSSGSGLRAGGLHVYEALISVESAALTQYRLIYADSDGDGVDDTKDAYKFSDTRPTVIIGETDTGLENKVLADGSTLNDIINAVAASATNHGEFVKTIAALTKLWSTEGVLPKEAKSLVQSAAAQASIP